MEITYLHCLFAVLGQTFRSFPSLKKRYRSVLYVDECQDFQVCSSSSESVCVVKNFEQCSHQTFSRLRRRLSSPVKLNARSPCGCSAFSALSRQASCRRSYNLHGKVLSRFQIFLWVPRDVGSPISAMRTTNSSRSFRLMSLSLVQMASTDLT